MTSDVISDQPALDDALGRIGLVKGIAKHIANSPAPMTFGVHGDWGSGKTSFLKQLRYHLSGETDGAVGTPSEDLPKDKYGQQIVTIWFEAWRYQNEPVPVVALINEIRRHFGALAKLKSSVTKLSAVAIRSVLNSIGEIGAKLIGAEALPLHPDKIEAVGERWEREHLEQSLLSNTVHEFLQDAISVLLKEIKDGAENARVVVFIDDLDRCNPESAYRLLEGLRIYLSLNNCVFVLGMNQQVVIDAIAHNLTKGEVTSVTRNRAEAYLEKLCTNVWRLPLVENPSALMAEWISDGALKGRLVTDLSLDSGGQNELKRHALPPNPRRLKALANLLQRLIGALSPTDRQTLENASVLGASTLMQRLVILAYVYQFHGDLYQRWQNEPDFFQDIAQWVGGQLGKPKTLADGRTVVELPDHFGRLQLPGIATSDETGPVRTTVFRSNFPDPTAAEVFWIGRLIAQLGNRLKPEDFVPLLRLKPEDFVPLLPA